MKAKGAKIYLKQGRKTVITGSKIQYVWLTNSITWFIRALSACEVVVRVLKKNKNNILYAR